MLHFQNGKYCSSTSSTQLRNSAFTKSVLSFSLCLERLGSGFFFLNENRSKKESRLCFSFLMKSCSPILTGSVTGINRKFVEQGDQDYQRSNKVSLSKEIFGRTGIPIWLLVYQLSFFFPNVLFFMSIHLTSRVSPANSAVTFDLILPSSSISLLSITRYVGSGHSAHPQTPLKSHTRRWGYT